MEVNFTKRDLSTALLLANVSWNVERLEWRGLGGPWAARMTGRAATTERLWGLVDLLRCGVTVCDDGGAAWWGFVSAVEVHAGARIMRLALDEVWNRIAVRYQDDSPNDAGGEEHLTSWVSDAKSILRWGTREKIYDLGPATLAGAQAYARSLLAALGRPRARAWIDPAAVDASPYVVLECAGFWETLDWEYYSQPRGQAGSLVGGTAYNFGSSTVQQVSESFVSAGGTWNANEVWIRVKRYLATDALNVRITSTAGGGTVYATGTLTGSIIEDDMQWTRWVLSAPVAIGAGIKYLNVYRSGSLSSANYFIIATDQGLTYAGGSLFFYNGSVWAAPAPNANMAFLVTGEEDTGTQIKAMIEDGQFFDTCRLESTSGISGRLYRDGSLRIREEVERLLREGMSTGIEYLAQVDRTRLVRVYAKPDETLVRYTIAGDGQIMRLDGRVAMGSDNPAGSWASFGDAGAVGSLLGYETGVWMERVLWQEGMLRVV